MDGPQKHVPFSEATTWGYMVEALRFEADRVNWIDKKMRVGACI